MRRLIFLLTFIAVIPGYAQLNSGKKVKHSSYATPVYLELGGGYAVSPRLEVDGPGLRDRLDLDNGYTLNAGLGVEIMPGVRVGIQGGYHDKSANKFMDQPVFLDGDISVSHLTLNAYYDFKRTHGLNLDMPFYPYFGLGIGAATADIQYTGTGTTERLSADDDDTAVAVKMMVGGHYKLSPKTKLGLEYRFFATSPLQYKDTVTDMNGNFVRQETQDLYYESHDLMLTFLYEF